jgi:hypothetical protein
VAHAGEISLLIDMQMIPFAILGAVLWSRHRRSAKAAVHSEADTGVGIAQDCAAA